VTGAWRKSHLIGVLTIGDVIRELHEEDDARMHSLAAHLGGTRSNEVF
jgi:Mg/Co/Ni transporter MgtE